MRAGLVVLALLLSAAAFAEPAHFSFEAGGKQVDGLLTLPAGKPRALILYFHRAVEDRNASVAWGALLGTRGFAVAGYTATGSTNTIEEARAAIRSLRNRAELARLPAVAMGASLGTRTAARWFGEDPDVRALILLVPGDPAGTCASLAKAAGRPVLMIQAQNDDVVDPSSAEALRNCRPRGSMLRILPGRPHRFPPSDASDIILSWLDQALARK